MESTQFICRSLEPVAKLLNRELQIPQIYFETLWPPIGESGHIVDVLAVDRAGIGDVHTVEIKDDATQAFATIPSLMGIPAHYRWLAFYESTVTPEIRKRLISKLELYPASGAGRIGVISIDATTEDTLVAKIIVHPERFHGLKYSKVEEYLRGLEPDLYVKD